MIIVTADGTRIELLPPCAHPHPCRPEEGFVPEECSVPEEECPPEDEPDQSGYGQAI